MSDQKFCKIFKNDIKLLQKIIKNNLIKIIDTVLFLSFNAKYKN